MSLAEAFRHLPTPAPDSMMRWCEGVQKQIELWDYHNLGQINEWPNVWKELYQMHGNGD